MTERAPLRQDSPGPARSVARPQSLGAAAWGRARHGSGRRVGEVARCGAVRNRSSGAARGGLPPAGRRGREVWRGPKPIERDGAKWARLETLREGAARLDERVPALAGGEDFVTVLIGQLDPDGTVSLVHCGHPPPLRIRTDLPMSKSGNHSQPRGRDPQFGLEVFNLEDGECLWCFTDGVADARTKKGRVVDSPAPRSGCGAGRIGDPRAAHRPTCSSPVRGRHSSSRHPLQRTRRRPTEPFPRGSPGPIMANHQWTRTRKLRRGYGNGAAG
jgi:hypothetical protein